jgi:Phage integrase, N-terminal SAM-like domain
VVVKTCPRSWTAARRWPGTTCSPKGMETTESHLRCHLRPYLGRRQLRQITPSSVLRWQHELEAKLSHSGVMACRSILLRILEAARKEHLLATNPVREVEAPKPRLDPDQVFGHQRRRTLTPRRSGTSWPPAGCSTATTS